MRFNNGVLPFYNISYAPEGDGISLFFAVLSVIRCLSLCFTRKSDIVLFPKRIPFDLCTYGLLQSVADSCDVFVLPQPFP
jgi:hypothetical protein